ncbi:MAG: DUF302 domain-containing protein [Bryobacteraceae bacterium]
MLYEVASSKPLNDIDRDLRAAAAENKFGVLTVHDLQETMRNKGVDFNGTCLIYEVCNPHQAKKVLEANGAVSTALPCRISVYAAPDGKFRVATLLPTAVMSMFGNPELEPVAAEVESVMRAIMNSAAGGQ